MMEGGKAALKKESEGSLRPSMAGIVGSDRVVALPSPWLHLRGVWATVCHYPERQEKYHT